MTKKISVLVGLLCLIGSSAASQITSLSHPDNLVSTHRLRCISISQVRNVHTPADLAGAVIRCSRQGKYDNAIQLFFVYSVYAYFDQKRMTDDSAASAIGALNSYIFSRLSDRRRRGLIAAADRLKDKNGQLFQSTCSATRELGPPDYVPLYMLAHSLGAFDILGETVRFKSRQELMSMLRPVDQGRLWREALFDVNECPR